MLLISLLLFFLFLIFIIFFYQIIPTDATINKTMKGPKSDTVNFIHYLDENIAIEEIKSGKLDAYFFRIPLDIASDLKNEPKLKQYERNSGSFGLLFNPAPSNSSIINPFQFKEIRYAMNFLINREFISNELLNGYGIPLVDPYGIYSPEYLSILDTVESFGFHYDPQVAEKIVSSVLSSKGAKKIGHLWYFNNHPITIKILIRSDDSQRKSLGEIVSDELEKIGFKVVKDFADLNKANKVVYGSNPVDLSWHIYTEAFSGTSSFVNFNPTVVAQMYSPWYSNMPGGKNPSYWQYRNSTIDEITQKLVFLNYTSIEQRTKFLRDATVMGIQESVRIFLVKNIEPYVASSSVHGLINDFGAGITSTYSLFNANSTIRKNILNIGVKQIYQGAWNDIGGFTDAYSIDIYSAIADSAIFRDPFNGEIHPLRVFWTNITTAGPLKKFFIPNDVQIWNTSSQEWTNIKNGDQAMSKVTLHFLYSKWHHGEYMNKADLLYSLYFLYEWGTHEDSNDVTFDPEYTSRAALAVPLNKGFRFLSNDTIESYVNQWNFDKKEIADRSVIWSTQPWEISAALERLVVSNVVAYSKSESLSKNVDWISLIIPEHANLIEHELEKMKQENYIPPSLIGFVSDIEAKKRYDASIRWISEHHNAVISNGPFYLDNYNVAGRIITIKAFRDNTYPFDQNTWSNFTNPKLTKIESLVIPKYVKIGSDLKIRVNTSIVNTSGFNNTTVKYFLFDLNNKIVQTGIANLDNKTLAYEININKQVTKAFHHGPYTLKIFAFNNLALRPDISTNVFIAIP